jgi:hypothetical protein
MLIMDSMIVFQVWVGTGSASAAGGPATVGSIGQNINFQLGTGNTSSGISGAYVDYSTISTTATAQPFTIVGLVQSPPGVNGRDITTAGNMVEVIINQSWLKAAAIAA